MKSAKIKVLLIISSDYGELGQALYFLRGLDNFFTQYLVTVPLDRLKTIDGAGFGPITGYDNFADISKLLDNFRPDLVVMFSGYLITTTDKFSFLGVGRLVKEIATRGIKIATSDPFLRQQDNFPRMKFASVLPHPLLRNFVVEQALRWRLEYLARVFCDTPHFYPANPASLPNASNDSHGFFNHVEKTKSQVSDNDEWVFVLSEIDYRVQTSIMGQGKFRQFLEHRIAEAVTLGKQVNLIVPEILANQLNALNRCDAIKTSSYLAFEAYQSLINNAEYVFYWNYFSFSVLPRMLLRRPVLFFAEGHMVNLLHPLLDIGLDLFYQGWKPGLLDIAKPLDANKLHQGHKECLVAFDTIIESLMQLDNSQQLLDELVQKDSST